LCQNLDISTLTYHLIDLNSLTLSTRLIKFRQYLSYLMSGVRGPLGQLSPGLELTLLHASIIQLVGPSFDVWCDRELGDAIILAYSSASFNTYTIKISHLIGTLILSMLVFY